MMGGVITALIGGGRLVSRTWRYKSLVSVGLPAPTLSFEALAWSALTDGGVANSEVILVVLGWGSGYHSPI
jgi:hypothetical protein